MTQDDFARMATQLNALLDEKLGLRKGPLAQRARRAGRRLPARVRAALLRVAEAETMSAHPKLAQRIDAVTVRRARAEAEAHLKTIDPADRRLGVILGALGGLAFNVLLFLALLLVVLRWQGFV